MWGSGLIKRSATLHPVEKVLAVRGKISLKTLVEQGLLDQEEATKVALGDPALLMPRFFTPPLSKNTKTKIGVIPHFSDYEFTKKALKQKGWRGKVQLIDICAPLEKVIGQISGCRATISSSLHGIIFSHAYRVPSAWCEPGGCVLMGDGCKFLDYHSIFYEEYEFLRPLKSVEKFSSTEELLEAILGFVQPSFPIDTKELWLSCPFLPDK